MFTARSLPFLDGPRLSSVSPPMNRWVFAAAFFAIAISAEAQLRPSDPQGGIPVSPLEPAALSVGYDVSIATDGSRYFAAWSGGWTNNRDIVGARLGPEGEVLDPEGVPIAPTYEGDEDPVVVWDGSDWLVFHWAGRLGGRVVKLDASGRVVTGRSLERVRVTDAIRVAGRVYLSFIRFDLTFAPTVSWGVLADDLTIVEEIPLSTRPSGVPRIAADGTTTVVVWESWEDPYTVLNAATIDLVGVVVEQGEVTRVNAQSPTGDWFPSFHPDVSWDGSSWIIVWSESGIRAVILGQSGETGEPFMLDAVDGSAHPAIASHGGESVVTYTTPGADGLYVSNVNGIRLIGTTIAERFEIALAAGWIPAPVATNGRNFVVVAGGMAHVIDTSDDVTVSAPYPLTFGFRSEPLPDIIGEQMLLLTLQDAERVRAWRFSRDGRRLDPPDRPIVIEGPSSHVAAASDDTFLIAWAADGGRFVGQRISTGGSVIDDEPFVIAENDEERECSLAAAASDGVDFLVVFQCTEVGPGPTIPSLLRTAIVSASGETSPPSAALVPHEFSQLDPAVAWTGSRYQLAWSQQLTPWPMFPRSPPVEYELSTMQLDREGKAIQGTLRVVVGRTTSGNLTTPAVASNGMTVLVSGGSGGELLTPEGELLGRVEYDAPVWLPRAIRTGSDYLVWAHGGRTAVRVDPAADGIASTFEYFDPDGVPRLGGIGALSGGRRLLSYTSRWIPFPRGHAGFLDRAYYRISEGQRRRTVRR